MVNLNFHSSYSWLFYCYKKVRRHLSLILVQWLVRRTTRQTKKADWYDTVTQLSCLFTETPGLIDVQPVEMLQDQAQCILGDYVRGRYSRQPTRFGRFLLMLPSLRGVRQSTVERLFFKETIGDIPIQRLLGDMYLMEKSYA